MQINFINLDGTEIDKSKFLSMQNLYMGSIPIMPMHLLCLEVKDEKPDVFNINKLLEVNINLNKDSLAEATYVLIANHDALRLRFSHSTLGWQTFLTDLNATVPFSYFDLSFETEGDHSIIIENIIEQLQHTLSLTNGPLFRIVYFYLGNNRPNRLLFMFHHLICDGFSLAVLLNDFYSIYEQISKNLEINLPFKSTTLKDYSEWLFKYAQSEELLAEVNYWITEERKKLYQIPLDFPEGILQPTRKSSITIKLCKEETKSLLALSKSKISVKDILLAAYFQSYIKWTGQKNMILEDMSHGRICINPEIKLLRTVGWISNIYPLHLIYKNYKNAKEIVFDVKMQLSHVPNNGIGYNLLKYTTKNKFRESFQSLQKPQVFFNYLGRSSNIETMGNSLIKPAREEIRNSQSLQRFDPMRIWLTAFIYNNELQASIEYQINLHRKETVEQFVCLFSEELRKYSMP